MFFLTAAMEPVNIILVLFSWFIQPVNIVLLGLLFYLFYLILKKLRA